MAKCTGCGAEITHVRDKYTGAAFPVNAVPQETQGFELGASAEGERSPSATQKIVILHMPHYPCPGQGEEEMEPPF